MREIHDSHELRHQAQAARGRGDRIGMVPIVGGMHDGQLALLRAAAAQCDLVIAVSTLPRTAFDGAAGDILWRPPAATATPMISFAARALGSSRDDIDATLASQVHAVVATAAATLPNRIFLSTLHVPLTVAIRHALADLLLEHIEVQLVPAQRSGDGVAVSAVTEAMTPDARAIAREMRHVLDDVEALVARGEQSLGRLRGRATVRAAGNRRADLRYLEFLDGETLSPVSSLAGVDTILVVAGMRIDGQPVVDCRTVTPAAAARDAVTQ